MRITAHIDEELGQKLKQFVEDRYRGRHGSLSWVIETAIKEYLDRESDKNP